MMDAADELRKVQATYPSASGRQEGGRTLLFLPAFKFVSGGTAITMDLLLHPSARGGYATRLFFREKLARGPNWTQDNICGENWFTPSWNNVVEDQSWLSMLANHLLAVQ